MLLTPEGLEYVTQEKAKFSSEEAKIIRQYKQLLRAHGLGATHWCRACQRAERDFELRIVVNDQSVTFECPHRLTEHRGFTA